MTNFFTDKKIFSALPPFFTAVFIIAGFFLIPIISNASVLFILTDPASNMEEDSAQLNGYVSVSSVEFAEIWFEYGTVNFEYTTRIRTLKGDAQTFSERVYSLIPNTTYSARIVARDTGGTFRGNTVTFQTKSITYGLPSVSTYSTSERDDNSALIRGYINTHGDISARAWFEWGQDTSLGRQTAFIAQDGTGQTAASLLSGLLANTRYYYRIVAQNEAGTSYGDIRYFDTEKLSDSVSKGEPSITTGKTTLLDGDIVSVSGFVDPKRVPTETWFEWGETTSLGNSTKRSAKRTDSGSFSDAISGLKKGTLYYYRAVGSNENGTAYGLTKTVTGGGLSDNTPVSIAVSTGNILFKPEAITGRAETPSNTTLFLRGTARTGGGGATAWFEWGQDTSLGNKTPIKFIGDLPSQGVSDSVFGLVPSTTYFYRLVVSNERGIAYGNIQNIKMPAIFIQAEKIPAAISPEYEAIPIAPEPEPHAPSAVFFVGDIFGEYTPEWILIIFLLFVLGLSFFKKI